MSNQQVGKVYEELIKSICNASKVDFEESGVDASLLDDLKQGWQKRLTESGVAKFPWDPVEEPPPITNPPTLLSNAGNSSQRSATGQHTSAQSTFDDGAVKKENIKSEGVKTENIKTEPGAASGIYSSNTPRDPDAAFNRATKLISETFGSQGQGLMMPGQQRPGLQLPGQSQSQQQSAQQARPNQQQQARGPPQTDGPDENTEDPVMRWNAIMQTRREEGSIAPSSTANTEFDAQLASYIRERGKALDDGGIMVTMPEYKAKRRSRKRKLANLAAVAESPDAPGSSSSSSSSSGAVRTVSSSMAGLTVHDGAGDGFDDEDTKNGIHDEDAINSDLDDPEDDLDNEVDEGDASMDMMLCMYEKVARVKNKWKCTLKDGVLTVNKKEYVFHKSTGEYEW